MGIKLEKKGKESLSRNPRGERSVGMGRRTGHAHKIGVGRTETFRRGDVRIQLGDSEQLCRRWPKPIAIIVDGPYGLGSFPGDPHTVDGLIEFYRPHVATWSQRATPETTLWFWNSELGWATVHPLLIEHGWTYRSCHIWDKGLSHVAGNANSKTLRKFPVVTEVCVQYVKEAYFGVNGQRITMKDWVRSEWLRTGIPLNRANNACNVKNAATRKYLTADHLWYYPPVPMFELLSDYANRHGDPIGRPYYSADGKHPITGQEWARMRAKFNCRIGINNVWDAPPVRGQERLRNGTRCAHMNQKPLRLLKIAIEASTDPGNVVWEPFGGLCSVAVASHQLGRRCYSAELLPEYFKAARERLAEID